jgi:hypothetical protein
LAGLSAADPILVLGDEKQQAEFILSFQNLPPLQRLQTLRRKSNHAKNKKTLLTQIIKTSGHQQSTGQ